MATTNSNRRSARNQDAPAKPDQLRSLHEWKQLPVETLKLKCDANRLPNKGKKLELSLRLFQHFHPDGVARVRSRNRQKKKGNGDKTGSTEGVIDDLPPSPPEIIRADDEPGEDGNAGAGTNDSTQPYDDDGEMGDATTDTTNTGGNDAARKRSRREVTPPPQDDAHLNLVVQKAVDASIETAIANALRPVLEEMTVSRERAQLAEDECRALRSQLANTGNNTISTSPSVRTPAVVTAVATSSRSVPVPVVSATTTAGNDSSAVSVNTLSPPTSSLPVSRKNPFPLPGLLKKYLLIIEQGEYLDFEKIKPKRIDQTKRDEDSEQGFGVAMTTHHDEDTGEETLRLKKVSTNKLETFPEWLECWNKFLSARLHYKPLEHALLMAYQRKITSYAKRFRFSAVYAYDVVFRKTVAAERSVHKDDRTCLWDKQNDDIKNEFLGVEQLLAPRTCFKCKEKGHMSANCPNPNKNKNFSGNNNRQGFNGARNMNTGPRFPPGPPPPPPPMPQPPQPFPSFHQFQSPYGNPITYHQPGPVGPPTGNTGQQGGKKCNGFNHNGYCWRGPTCYFKHVCNRCGSDAHGGINCDNNTSTGFHPSPSGYRPRF